MKHEQKYVYSINLTPILLAPLYLMFQSRGSVTNDLATYYDPPHDGDNDGDGNVGICYGR